MFRYHRQGGGDEAEAFVALLLASVQQDEIPIYVVTTMRSEFIGDCALFYELPEIMNQGQFLTPRLTRDQQREAIVEPAELCSGTIEPRLVNTLLNEMKTDPDQLPILQHCLMRMWTQKTCEVSETSQVCLSLHDYEAIGGLQHALSKHADEAFAELAELNEKGQKVAKIMFRRLSERGIDQRDIRRPVKINEVAGVAGVPETEVIKVAEIFRRPDRCFLTPSLNIELDSENAINISHESLIRQWERLNKWVEEEAESARMYTRLEDAAVRWAQGQAALWRDPDLTLATQWKDREKPTSAWAGRYGKDFELAMRFFDASVHAREGLERQKKLEEKRQQEERERQRELETAQKLAKEAKARQEAEEKARLEAEQRVNEQVRSARRLRWLAIELAVVFLMAVGAAVFAWINQQKAKEAQEEAERQALFAQAGQLAAQAQNVFETYPQRSLLLAVEALNVTLREGEPRVLAAEEVLREALAHTRGRGLSGMINDVVISPDGRWLVIARENEPPQLWELHDGELAADPVVLSGPKSQEVDPENLVISPDSRWLVAWGQYQMISLWDIKATDPAATLNTLTRHDLEITAVAFSPDSRWLATGSWDTTVRLWDLSNLSATLLVLRGHKAPVSQITLSADNRWMMTMSNDKVVLWELKGDSADLVYNYENISTIAFSPDSRWMVTGNDDGTVQLRSLRDIDNDPIVLSGHNDKIVDMVVSPDSRWLVTRSYDGTARLWDLTVSDQFIKVLSETGITSMAISPDGHWLIAGNKDSTLGMWDLTANVPTKTPLVLRGHEGPVDRLSITADSHWLVTGSKDSTARLWDLTSSSQGVTPLLLSGDKAGISSVAISPDNHRVATGSKDGTARL